MRKYDAVLFDLDGTVLDTSVGILKSIRETIKEFNLKELSEDELKTFIGPPVEWSFNDKYGLEGDELKAVVMCFRDRYSNHNLLDAIPYEGIYELLEYFKEKGIRTAIATYKKQDYATKLLCEFGFNKYCDYMYGSDYEGKLKKADIINLCIESLNTTNDRVLMVGDSKHDANGAKAIGVDFAGVSFGFGFGSQDDINDFDHVIYVDKALDLKALFEEEE